MAMIPDLERARRFLAANPPPGRVLVCAITGSHYYGFPSGDSDVDLKGIHLAPTRALLGLAPPPASHDALTIFEGVEHDLTTHELARALGLLLKGNGNVLERIFSPLQLVESPDLEELRALATGALSRLVHGHYHGYARGMCREHEREPSAKSLLYVYRVALTGAHALRTGEIRGDVLENARDYGVEGLDTLVEYKRAHAEHSGLPEALDREHRARWPRLLTMLDDAAARSPLPDEPANAAAIDAWLVERRVREGLVDDRAAASSPAHG